jgi:integrase/recombinase XerD
METTTQSLYAASGGRKYLNAREREAFLIAALRSKLRRRLLCELLAYTGCRLSEALAIAPEDVNGSEAYVVFRTLKRRKMHFRAVPIPADFAERLAALPPMYGQGRTPRCRLFPWCRETAWRYVKQVMDAAEIAGIQACPKGLRHGFGMRAIARGVPESLVQRWLGHARLETTAIYLCAVGPEERAFAERVW